MNYEAASSFLLEKLPIFQLSGEKSYKGGLNNINQLCTALHQPQQQFKSIHIAGTNGKGSVAHFLAAILEAHGLKVGLYTSPHYFDFRERIKINGASIPKTEVVNFLVKYQAVIEQIQPSFFEATTALAFWYFAQQQVDIGIIEAGVGGEEDATNIISPLLSIITNVSYDHQNLLGTTLEEIATAKAGIIKPNTPVVIGETHPATAPIFEQIAKQRKATITFADQHIQLSSINRELDRQQIIMRKNIPFIPEKFVLPFGGSYAIANLQTVLQALTYLSTCLIPIKKYEFLNGFKAIKNNISYFGRWQIASRAPFILCDSAHNEAALKQLIADVKTLGFKKITYVLGFTKGKNIAAMMALLPVDGAKYIFTKSKNKRAATLEDLELIIKGQNIDGQYIEPVELAVQSAIAQVGKDELLLVSGSSFLVAEALKEIKKAH